MLISCVFSHFVRPRTFPTNIKKHSHNIFNIHNSFIFRSARKSGWTERKKCRDGGRVGVIASKRKTHAQQTKQTTKQLQQKKISCMRCGLCWHIIKMGFILCVLFLVFSHLICTGEGMVIVVAGGSQSRIE